MAPRDAGITLVDTTIAVVVVAVILGLAYPGFMAANDTISTSGMRDRAERAGDRILKEVTEELRSGFVLDAAAPGAPPYLTVAVPREDVLLADLTAEGGVPWEAGKRTIRFRPVRNLLEADAGEDLNGDGDEADEFSLGVIEVVEGGVARPVTNTARVMLALPGYGGDLDGDGVADPLFTVNGRSVTIRIRMLTRTDRGRIVTTAVRGDLRLRNAQR